VNPLELDGAVTVGTRESWATVSPCGTYRYALGRTWDPAPEGEWDGVRPVFSIIMLNPSTADHALDDPTIRRCIHFAKQEGCGALVVRNLFALRATDPRELLKAADPHGPLNEEVLDMTLAFASRVAAWGALSSARLRKLAVYAVYRARQTHTLALGRTKRGDPRHPLYLPNSARAK
jgi:hypothetical protein